jgi:hypothetical protein
MKNSFKFGFLALAISLSVAACNSNKTEEAAGDSSVVNQDSLDAVALQDSITQDSVNKATQDSIKKDSLENAGK